MLTPKLKVKDVLGNCKEDFEITNALAWLSV
jgi:hypothetical protein